MKWAIVVVCFLIVLHLSSSIKIKIPSSLVGIGIGLSIPLSSLPMSSRIYFPLWITNAVNARNLPTSNDASGINRGKVEALVPIVQMAFIANKALGDLPNISNVNSDLKLLPSTEKEFKRLFDEYSENISYKQVFMDKNAFLVYYTKGFDGPNRPNIETEDEMEKKEKEQFGSRNDAWIAVDEARAEVSYLLENNNNDIKDLKSLLTAANSAFDNYLRYSPIEDVKTAKRIILEQ